MQTMCELEPTHTGENYRVSSIEASIDYRASTP